MAKAKSVNDIKNVSIKKNGSVVKKNTIPTTVTKKRGRPPKKKIVLDDVVKKKTIKEEDAKLVKKKKTNKVVDNDITSKIPIKKISAHKTSDKKELTKEEIIAQRKARNRKKYQNQQKKYLDNKLKNNKKIDFVDDSFGKTSDTNETSTIEIDKKDYEDIAIEPKKKENIEKEEIEQTKERRKENRKQSQFTKTIIDLKTKSIDTINIVKEKTTDQNIPIGKTKEESKKRKKRYLKEAIVYALLLTIINVLCIVFIDYFNFLRLFDDKYLNIIVTVVISLIFNFFIAFMVDCFVTDVWLKGKRKKKDGGQNGDSGVIKE